MYLLIYSFRDVKTIIQDARSTGKTDHPKWHVVGR